MNEPVSICIPTYNGEAYLRQALQSAVDQTYTHVEILIADDGSTDSTLALANEFTAKHTHVRLVRNADKKGMIANWEACVAEARYDWIKFLFQDDVLMPACVEDMMCLCSETKTLIAFCRRDFIVEDNVPQKAFEFLRVVPRPENLFAEGRLPTQTLAKQVIKHGTRNIIGEPSCWLFHKKLLVQTGPFDARFKQSVDLEFALRAAFTAGLAFTPKPLVKFRMHGGSQTTSNTQATGDPAAFKRSIRSLWGDDLLLHNTYLTDERFKIVREQWPAKLLSSKIRYLYLRACREYGSLFINDALQDVIATVPLLKNLRYTYLRYKIERYRYKALSKKHSHR